MLIASCKVLLLLLPVIVCYINGDQMSVSMHRLTYLIFLIQRFIKFGRNSMHIAVQVLNPFTIINRFYESLNPVMCITVGGYTCTV